MTRSVEWPPYRPEWQVRTVREGCSDCATDRARAHTALGHHPTLQSPPNRNTA